MSAHDFQDEATLVGISGGRDGIHSLDDPVKGGVGTDGHVGAAEVIVDGAYHAHDVQVGVLCLLFLSDLTWKGLM